VAASSKSSTREKQLHLRAAAAAFQPQQPQLLSKQSGIKLGILLPLPPSANPT
ncbi:hypothetical protein STEG23_038282, partial [Scotinomys teguina]